MITCTCAVGENGLDYTACGKEAVSFLSVTRVNDGKEIKYYRCVEHAFITDIIEAISKSKGIRDIRHEYMDNTIMDIEI